MINRITHTLFQIFCLISVIAAGYSHSAQSLNWQMEGQPLGEHFDTMPVSANPQNFMMAQDKKGFIYVANGAGILVYNGNDWQLMSYGDQQVFFEFALSEDDRIYTGTAGDLGYFEADKQGKWYFNSLISDLKVPEFNYVLHVMTVGSHVLYLTPSHLFHYHPEFGLSWIPESFQPEAMIYDGEQVLISSSSQEKMFSYSLDDKKLSKKPEFDDLDVSFFKGMLSLNDRKILLFSPIKLYQRTLNKIEIFRTEIDDWLAESFITDVKIMDNKYLVISTHHSGIAIIDLNGKLIRFYNNEQGLKDNQINNLLIDNQKNIWISHPTNGISRVELNSPLSQYVDEKNFAVNTSVVEFKDQIFVGTFSGLFKLNLATDLEQQAKFIKVPSELQLIFSFLVDQENLFISHVFGVDILTTDAQGNAVLSNIHDSSHYNGRDVRKLIRSNQDNNVIYGISINGLIRLVKDKGKWSTSGLLPNFNQDLYSIHQDDNGKLWLGTIKGEFYKISELENWPNVTIEPIPFSQSQKPSVAMVFGLGANVLLNSTEEKILMTNEAGNGFIAATMADWQENNVRHIEILEPNNRGGAWFATRGKSSGINRVGLLNPTKDDRYTIDFSQLDKLKLEFVHGLYTDNNSDLWINSRGRIVRYRTARLQDESLLQQPVLTKVIELESGRNLLTNSRFDFNSLNIGLAAEENAISIHFSAVNYSNNNTLEYRYRLLGHKQIWSDWARASFAEFTNLESGEFTFELQYRTNPSNLSPIAQVHLMHQPYWHQLFWVRILALVSLLVCITAVAIIYARFRNHRLRIQAQELENQIVKRTQIISQQNTQLREMDEAKNRFFANVSHEFRTPLSLAIGPLKELMGSSHIENPQDQEYLNMALKNSLHMMDLLGQVLDINRLDAGGMPMKIIKINATASLQYCIQRFSLQAEKQQIMFKTIGLEEPLFIHFDADHLEKIILNLISNAVKFSPPKSTIEIGMEEMDNKIIIWVKDEGYGISSQDQQHIFDRFYQGRTASHTIQLGTGIGLALVKELLNLHRGEVVVSSRQGKGTQFTITLMTDIKRYSPELIDDFKVDEEAGSFSTESDQYLPVEIKITEEADAGYRKNLLIVDDNPELRQFIRSLLQPNYNISEADNGEVAFQYVIENHPDLIISDVMMPVMDGLALAKKLKSTVESSHIPLILLTAKSTKREIVEGLQQGADDYLSKPFDSAELVARIAAQLAQKKRIAEDLYRKFNLKNERNHLKIEKKDKFTRRLDSLFDEKLSDSEFDVEQMCQKMNVSRSTLFRQVKNRFNCTPKQLLKVRRLEVSLKMLQDNLGSISEVAYAVGFQSLSTFSGVFNEHFKVPPTRVAEIKTPALSE